LADVPRAQLGTLGGLALGAAVLGVALAAVTAATRASTIGGVLLGTRRSLSIASSPTNNVTLTAPPRSTATLFVPGVHNVAVEHPKAPSVTLFVPRR
jgi:hypothetical protein